MFFILCKIIQRKRPQSTQCSQARYKWHDRSTIGQTTIEVPFSVLYDAHRLRNTKKFFLLFNLHYPFIFSFMYTCTFIYIYFWEIILLLLLLFGTDVASFAQRIQTHTHTCEFRWLEMREFFRKNFTQEASLSSPA